MAEEVRNETVNPESNNTEDTATERPRKNIFKRAASSVRENAPKVIKPVVGFVKGAAVVTVGIIGAAAIGGFAYGAYTAGREDDEPEKIVDTEASVVDEPGTQEPETVEITEF